jgi:hypothetical protein
MAKAVWKGVVLAESDRAVTVEGNYYFPDGSVKKEYLRPSERHGELSRRGGEWGAQRGCRLVLSGALRRSCTDQGPHCVLEGGARRTVAARVI